MSTPTVAQLEAEWVALGGLQRQALRAIEERDKLQAEIDRLRAKLDRAINAAVEHFGENAVRYKLCLNKHGRPHNEFPLHMDGHWYALQRADDDAHVGLALRCSEAEAEVTRLRAALEDIATHADPYGLRAKKALAPQEGGANG